MARTRIANLVLRWYARHGRDLPWRRSRTPYRTWVSEVMLQQTRVETVIPYFRRWMRRFPSVRTLAATREQSVLVLWEGLGYYSRARNLHRAARIVMRSHGGRIPSDPHALRALPGVGDYIAAALSSIEFGRDVVALDANVMRVLARLGCLRHPVGSPPGRRWLQEFAIQNLPKRRAGDFNEAFMDLGSQICLPRRPRCDVCPLRDVCEARRRGLQDKLPVRRKKSAVPHLHSRAAVIVRGDWILLLRRASAGLLGGLWEFPKSAPGPLMPTQVGLQRELRLGALGVGRLHLSSSKPLAVIEHRYSHFSVTVQAFVCATSAVRLGSGVRWVPMNRLSSYPMGKVDRNIARQLALSASTAAA